MAPLAWQGGSDRGGRGSLAGPVTQQELAWGAPLLTLGEFAGGPNA